MSSPLDNVAIVLYQPQDLVNVAGIVRVMSNFGLSDLRLIEPAAFDPFRILGIAHHTERLVASSRRFSALGDAVADCSYIMGTTGRPRQADRVVMQPREAAPHLLGAVGTSSDDKVAVLFGPEQDGLPNEALDLCHAVITIPTHQENRSLNLAQAALVIAYELWVTAAEGPAVESSIDLATGAEREQIFVALEGLLGRLYPGTTETRMKSSVSRLRTMIMRAAPRSEEATALTNLLLHAARSANPPRMGPKPSAERQ